MTQADWLDSRSTGMCDVTSDGGWQADDDSDDSSAALEWESLEETERLALEQERELERGRRLQDL